MSCLYIFQSKINTKYFNDDISGYKWGNRTMELWAAWHADYCCMSIIAVWRAAEIFLQQRNVEAVTGEVWGSLALSFQIAQEKYSYFKYIIQTYIRTSAMHVYLCIEHTDRHVLLMYTHSKQQHEHARTNTN